MDYRNRNAIVLGLGLTGCRSPVIWPRPVREFASPTRGPRRRSPIACCGVAGRAA
jgi:hypothetical protein